MDCGRREEKSHKEGIIFMTEFSWRKRSDGTSPNGRRWKTEVHFLKRKRDLVREFKAMHEDNFLSSWLRKCKCCKAPMSETEHAPDEDHLHFGQGHFGPRQVGCGSHGKFRLGTEIILYLKRETSLSSRRNSTSGRRRLVVLSPCLKLRDGARRVQNWNECHLLAT